MLEKILYKVGEGLTEYKKEIQHQNVLLAVGHALNFGDCDGNSIIYGVVYERSKLPNKLKDVYYGVVERILPEVYYKNRIKS